MKNQTIDRSTLLIWDKESLPPQSDYVTVLWRSFGKGDDPDVISIPRLVDEQADSLRSRYLAWLNELGETRIKNTRVVDHLELRPEFSYWWMTLLAEKSYFKSPGIYNAIRLLALEELINNHQPVKIILLSSDQTVTSILRRWCRKAGIDFEWRQSVRQSRQISRIRCLFLSLPYTIQAILSLGRYIWHRWPLRTNANDFNTSSANKITFMDYLIHLNRSALIEGRFASNFWTDLIRVLERMKTSVNWIHLYAPHDALPNSKQARDLIARFNHKGSGLEFHAMLEGAISLSIVFNTLHDYFQIVLCSIKLAKIRHFFRPAGSNLDLWPLFKHDWLDSMRGSTAIWNCIVLNLFEKKMNQLPHQSQGVYLQENQGWEMAFIYAWRSAGHGQLIGVPHSVVRYWDLRYFSDPKSYRCSGKNDLPLPDQVALNGPAAMKAYRHSGYPENQIVEVEALRYLYLTAKRDLNCQNKNLYSELRILVCGDVMAAASQQMMHWLVTAAIDMPPNTRYIIKPHPASPIIPSNYPSLKLQMTNAPLAELLTDCDVAFTSNNTSAAVDAYCSGIPVVQVLDGNTFDCSPLHGVKGVTFVTMPSELSIALRDARQRDRVIAEPYFCLDKELPHWRKLLGLNAEDTKKKVEN